MYLFYHTFQQNARTVFLRSMELCVGIGMNIDKIYYSMKVRWDVSLYIISFGLHYLCLIDNFFLVASCSAFCLSNSRERFL